MDKPSPWERQITNAQSGVERPSTTADSNVNAATDTSEHRSNETEQRTDGLLQTKQALQEFVKIDAPSKNGNNASQPGQHKDKIAKEGQAGQNVNEDKKRSRLSKLGNKVKAVIGNQPGW